ncbi:hypothetical protein PY093_08970 [Cytobacillus sp. S13-E01]|uniref:hypothetical protein n=1 Tax=Cytobacillus sp. S13-E01 TaxID=3031326 RepID=UPI0023D7D5F0|nr:hypothetical protein [Cytobacillus sp. S13-E01]MDF0726845.1 hypothetical protein [Cytobacillus sp. S13-E01]
MLYYQAEIMSKQKQAEIELKANEAWKFTNMKEVNGSYFKEGLLKIIRMSSLPKKAQTTTKCFSCCQSY